MSVTIPIKLAIIRRVHAKGEERTFPSEIRRFSIPSDSSFQDVKCILCTLWDDVQNLTTEMPHSEWKRIVAIEYLDAERDAIALDTEDEWRECVKIYVSELWNGDATGRELPLRMTMKRVAAASKKKAVAPSPTAVAVPPEVVEVQTEMAEVSPPEPFEHHEVQRPAEFQQEVHVDPQPTPVTHGPSTSVDAANFTPRQKLLSVLFNCNAVEEMMKPFETSLLREVLKVGPSGLECCDESIKSQSATYFASLSECTKNDQAFKFAQLFLHIYPNDAVMLYNAACIASRLGLINDSFAYLRRAVNAGFQHIEHLKSDSDLENLREDIRYEGILERVAELHPQQSTTPAPRRSASMIERIAQSLQDVDKFRQRLGIAEHDTTESAASTNAATIPAYPQSAVNSDVVERGEWRLPEGIPAPQYDSVPVNVRAILNVLPQLSVSQAQEALNNANGSVAIAINRLITTA